jgi:hypothetical protein
MTSSLKPLRRVVLLTSLAVLPLAVVPSAWANEAVIRKNLAERMPQLHKLDEVQRSPINGLWEVRIGSDILYTDAEGNYLMQGDIFDTREKKNVTQARVDKLTAFDFPALPLKDAIAIRQGNGSRKIAVFVDPNCGFCKRFERDLASLKARLKACSPILKGSRNFSSEPATNPRRPVSMLTMFSSMLSASGPQLPHATPRAACSAGRPCASRAIQGTAAPQPPGGGADASAGGGGAPSAQRPGCRSAATASFVIALPCTMSIR